MQSFNFGFKPVKMKPMSFGAQKPKRKAIGKSLRHQVWLKYMGNKAEGKCYCCRMRHIHFTDFQVGHNKAVAKDGKDNIANLRPICGVCNRGMKTKSIESYKKKYYSKPTAKPACAHKKVRKNKSSGLLGMASSWGKPAFKMPKSGF